MKPTYRHLIKILSCSLAIAAVLLCSMYVPVKAAGPKVLDPMDYLVSVDHYDNGQSMYFFRIWDNAIYQAYNGSSLTHTFTGSFDWELDTSYSSYRLSVSPVGAETFTSSPSTVIDIRDFKRSSVLDLTYTGEFRVDVYNAGNMDLVYKVNSNVVLYWYDKDFNFLTSSSSGTMENTGIFGAPSFVWAINKTIDMTIPENACYVVPRYAITFYHPTSGYIYRISSTEYESFTITATKDDIVENSLTMQRIEGQLGDLNDKADEILSGDDQMTENADRFESSANDADSDMNSALDKLEDLPDLNPDDVDLSFDGLSSQDGFSAYSNFFLTLSKDSLWVSIMLIVCTFIWVSTLLYGKRG